MNIRRNSYGLMVIVIVAAQGASANDLDYSMPSIFYDGMNAKLLNAGYREVRVTDAETGRLAAYDPDGSEVLLTVDPTTRRVVNEVYVHPGDG
ncbi:hypothetical protein [Tropicimonas marinistellae]|uniref:hypothetical protein n=1 Tax=Tropicimonas marinistellae TaxID=1739787 RepID=UPI000829C06F|nr:hypothetical protein [Tropicimonas marinistellae]